MEQVQAIGVQSFAGAPDPPAGAGCGDDALAPHLVIVSDMLQHMPGNSQYGDGPPDIDEFRRSPWASRFRVDLRGARVSVLYIRRHTLVAERVQGVAHAEFWNTYLEDMQACVDRFVRVPG
jgi:hypothetical protein